MLDIQSQVVDKDNNITDLQTNIIKLEADLEVQHDIIEKHNDVLLKKDQEIVEIGKEWVASQHKVTQFEGNYMLIYAKMQAVKSGNMKDIARLSTSSTAEYDDLNKELENLTTELSTVKLALSEAEEKLEEINAEEPEDEDYEDEVECEESDDSEVECEMSDEDDSILDKTFTYPDISGNADDDIKRSVGPDEARNILLSHASPDDSATNPKGTLPDDAKDRRIEQLEQMVEELNENQMALKKQLGDARKNTADNNLDAELKKLQEELQIVTQIKDDIEQQLKNTIADSDEVIAQLNTSLAEKQGALVNEEYF